MAANTTATQLARIEEKQDSLARKLDEYIANAEKRSDEYMARADKRVNGISTRLDTVELTQARSEHIAQEVETLKGQFRVWNGLNSVSALAAGVLAIFKR